MTGRADDFTAAGSGQRATRFAGRLAKVVTTVPIGGQSAFSGRILAVEQGDVILEEGRKRHKVPVAQIKRGHLAVEF